MFLGIFFELIFSKQYELNQEIRFYGNKITPYNNPFETYDFYSLPFCPYIGKDKTVPMSFGVAFLGNKYTKTNVSILFRNNVVLEKQCKKILTKDEIEKFKHAIHNHYIFQFMVDKLPVWGKIGSVSQDNSTFLFTKWHFSLDYNGKRVVGADITTGSPVNIDLENEITFTYSVTWSEAKIEKRQRYDKYSHSSVGNKVHYASLFNIVVVVLCVVLFTIALLLKSLGNDYTRYEKDAHMGDFDIDFHLEKGWKMVHADVFRKPQHEEMLASLIGAGAHIASTAVIFAFVNFLFGSSFTKSGKLNLAFGAYSFSGFASGYVSGGLYKRWGGKHWIRHLVIQTFLIPGAFLALELLLSVVAISYKSTQVFKVRSLITIASVLIFLVLPLTITGGIIGRNWFIIGPPPTQPSLIRRKIPKQPIYLRMPALMIIIGLIGAGSIILELQYVLTALLQYNFVYVWGFLLIVAFLLFIVVGCCSIVSTYYRLVSENYEWQWSSFLAPFAVGIYSFFYCLYYLNIKTKMTGTLQIAYFIAYSLLLCSIIGLICGFVGFVSSALFVRSVYKNLKTD